MGANLGYVLAIDGNICYIIHL